YAGNAEFSCESRVHIPAAAKRRRSRSGPDGDGPHALGARNPGPNLVDCLDGSDDLSADWIQLEVVVQDFVDRIATLQARDQPGRIERAAGAPADIFFKRSSAGSHPSLNPVTNGDGRLNARSHIEVMNGR